MKGLHLLHPPTPYLIPPPNSPLASCWLPFPLLSHLSLRDDLMPKCGAVQVGGLWPPPILIFAYTGVSMATAQPLALEERHSKRGGCRTTAVRQKQAMLSAKPFVCVDFSLRVDKQAGNTDGCAWIFIPWLVPVSSQGFLGPQKLHGRLIYCISLKSLSLPLPPAMNSDLFFAHRNGKGDGCLQVFSISQDLNPVLPASFHAVLLV